MRKEEMGSNPAEINNSFVEEWAAYDTKLEAAISYAERGYQIFPVPANCKGANVDFHIATSDVEKVRRWWTEAPDSNIGFRPCSMGWTCLDLDTGHDTEWVASNLPQTRTVQTPSGGFHCYYTSPERFGNPPLAAHIDVRDQAGYVLLPPSSVNGRAYTWLDENDPVALPDGVRAKLRGRKEVEKEPLRDDAGDDNSSNVAKARAMLAKIDPSTDGWQIAVQLRRDVGLTWYGAVEAFSNWSDTLPPEQQWPREKIEQVCRNGGKYGHGDQGQFAGAGADAYSKESLKQSAGTVRPKVRFKTGKPRKVTWLWNNWLPLGKLTLIAGRPGDGKSMITLAIAAAITTSGRWPDSTECGEPGDVLIWSSEDDWEDTIQPRFLAAGGDINRIHCIDAIEGTDGSVRPFNPATDMALLEDAVEQFPDTRLAIIDPIIVIAPGKAGDTADIRLKMVPMVSLAERRQIAILGITHFAKGTQEVDLLERFIGSQAWGAAARCAWITVKNEETGKRRLIRVKSSLGPEGDGFDFRMDGADVPGYPEIGQRHVVKWIDGVVRGPARKLFCEISGTDEGSKIQLARTFILEKVPTRGMNSTWLIEAANDAGHAPKTVRAAKAELIKEKLLHSAPGEDGKWWVYRTAYSPPNGLDNTYQHAM